jgi:glycosyltransferase involved in cell wall biosynthesis
VADHGLVRRGAEIRLLIAEDTPTTRCGNSRTLLEMTQHFAGRGHEFDLVYLEPGEFLPIYEQTCRSVEQVQSFLFGTPEPLRKAIGLARGVAAATRATPDLVYTHRYMDTFYGSAVAHLKGIPLVCSLDSPLPPTFGGHCVIALPSVSHFIAVSEFVKHTWTGAGLDASRIEVIHPGVDLTRFRPAERLEALRCRAELGLQADDFVVVFCGRLDAEKGLDVLLEAVHRLASAECRLVVVGGPGLQYASGEEADRYVSSLRRVAPDGALFLGARDDVVPVLHAADVVVVPSVCEDSFPRVLMEAMACGIPALGSRVGGIPELLTGSFRSFLFERGDSVALADRLRRLHGWQHREPRLGLACRQHVDPRFDLVRSFDELEATLNRVVATSRSRSRSGSSRKLAFWGRRAPRAAAGTRARP